MNARINVKAKARKRREPGKMSGHEAEHMRNLEARVAAGEVVSWRFEAVRLALAPLTTYTPDFMVVLPDGLIEMHEVKGSWNAPNQDASRVKLKVAAETFPEFLFVSYTKRAKKDGGGWAREEF